jgi:phenylalanyl-tRNA synthetase beta chain
MTGRKETESWKKNNGLTDFFDLKAAVHGIMDRLGLDKTGIESTSVRAGCFSEGLSYIVDGRKVVSFGRIVPQLLKDFEIRQDVFYGSFSWDNILNLLAGRKTEYGEIARFPEVRRDLALVLGKQVKFEDLEKAAFEAEKTLLKSVNLFDIYEDDRIGKDKRSYALSFILQDEERTLTDKVIEQVMSRILAAFRQKFGATLR